MGRRGRGKVVGQTKRWGNEYTRKVGKGQRYKRDKQEREREHGMKMQKTLFFMCREDSTR